MAAILMNNSVWRVETQHSLNAINGTNHRGVIIRLYNKRTGQEITVPLPVWDKVANAIQLNRKDDNL